MILLFVLILAAGIILRFPLVKGYLGERAVAFFLGKLNSDDYTLFHDVYIPTSDGFTQIDHLVLSKYGIFVIETKNYKGWIYGSERNTYWTQVIYNRKERFYNPIYQNYGHLKALQAYLNVEADDALYSIISFSTRSTLKKIDIQSDNVLVIYSPKIHTEIKKQNTICLSNFQVNQFMYKLKKLKKPTDLEKKQHVKDIKIKMKRQRQNAAQNICPRCEGKLVSRTGKYGPFMGCSSFPACRYVKK